MRNFFCLVLVFLLPFAISAKDLSPKQQKEVEALDEKIDELKEQKAMYSQRAEEAEIDAERLQFEGEFFDDAKVDWETAEFNRKKAAELRDQIQVLEKRKNQILSGSK